MVWLVDGDRLVRAAAAHLRRTAKASLPAAPTTSRRSYRDWPRGRAATWRVNRGLGNGATFQQVKNPSDHTRPALAMPEVTSRPPPETRRAAAVHPQILRKNVHQKQRGPTPPPEPSEPNQRSQAPVPRWDDEPPPEGLNKWETSRGPPDSRREASPPKLRGLPRLAAQEGPRSGHIRE